MKKELEFTHTYDETFFEEDGDPDEDDEDPDDPEDDEIYNGGWLNEIEVTPGPRDDDDDDHPFFYRDDNDDDDEPFPNFDDGFDDGFDDPFFNNFDPDQEERFSDEEPDTEEQDKKPYKEKWDEYKEQWDKLAEAEKEFILKHPLAAKDFYYNAVEASKEGLRRYPGSGHNGMGDAFRHGYWSALNVRDHGSDLAREYGDAHETAPNQSKEEKEMDLHNNAVGYEIGERASREGWSSDRILEEVEKALKDGRSQTSLK